MHLHGRQMLKILECMYLHESQGAWRNVLVWIAGSLHGSRAFTDAISIVASILESEQTPNPGSVLVSGCSCQPTA